LIHKNSLKIWKFWKILKKFDFFPFNENFTHIFQENFFLKNSFLELNPNFSKSSNSKNNYITFLIPKMWKICNLATATLWLFFPYFVQNQNHYHRIRIVWFTRTFQNFKIFDNSFYFDFVFTLTKIQQRQYLGEFLSKQLFLELLIQNFPKFVILKYGKSTNRPQLTDVFFVIPLIS
jgi:hypothetical protein